MQFSGRVALVTGGNSGIGRGIVQRFAREGAAVALVGRNPEKGIAVEAEPLCSRARSEFVAFRIRCAAGPVPNTRNWGNGIRDTAGKEQIAEDYLKDMIDTPGLCLSARLIERYW